MRECHGDLHLENLVLLDGVVRAFDAIEFIPELRWTDVACEVAFTIMDLEARGSPDLGWRFLNRYLEASGDYEALPLLDYLVVYRALVRARVATIRDAQRGEAAGSPAASRYLQCARARCASRLPPLLVLTCGLSGSGKSRAARLPGGTLGAAVVRGLPSRWRCA